MSAPANVDDLINPDYQSILTPKQWEVIQAVKKHKGIRPAADALGVARNAVFDHLDAARKRLARHGHAKGHWDFGVPAGYTVGKVTRQIRNEDGTFSWPRFSPTEGELEAMVAAAVEAVKERIPPVRKVAPPRRCSEDLCTQYTITDYHIGMQAHASEGDGVGADWNLNVAEDMLVGAIEHLSAKAPPSGRAILALLGDLLHFDGPDPVTPTHRHPLDSAGRQKTMIRTVVRSLRRVVQILLTKHALVDIVVMEGNHDLGGTPWLQELLTAIYENEPRVNVSQNELPFYAMAFGVNFIGFHHGHKRQKQKLPALFSSMFRELWGQTRKGYIHTGHYHEADEKEYPGTRVIQHPTLAAPDSHALRGGWMSEREMAAIHYHIKYGQAGRDFVTPEMLAAA